MQSLPPRLDTLDQQMCTVAQQLRWWQSLDGGLHMLVGLTCIPCLRIVSTVLNDFICKTHLVSTDV